MCMLNNDRVVPNGSSIVTLTHRLPAAYDARVQAGTSELYGWERVIVSCPMILESYVFLSLHLQI
jgi:hypothetical protein